MPRPELSILAVPLLVSFPAFGADVGAGTAGAAPWWLWPLLLAVSQIAGAGTPTGSAWLALAHSSDMLNLVGIALLAAASALSSLAVLPMFVRRGGLALVAIARLQVIVLAASASNLLARH